MTHHTESVWTCPRCVPLIYPILFGAGVLAIVLAALIVNMVTR